MLLEGRKAIVTGASSGIGKATAERLGREGANVCVNYYSDKEQGDAHEVVTNIERAGPGRAIAVQADVGSETDVERIVAETVTAFGGVDIMVNNAGIEKQIRCWRPLRKTGSEFCGPTSPGRSCACGRPERSWPRAVVG